MGAPNAPSVNMRPLYAGVGKLRRSDEAYFQAYLSFVGTAHRYDGAYLHLRGVSRDTSAQVLCESGPMDVTETLPPYNCQGGGLSIFTVVKEGHVTDCTDRISRYFVGLEERI